MITVVKPGDNQAITIHLDGATKLDLSAIANENITLVHVGDRLIILFANHAEVTIEPFYSDNGQPLPDITVELGPNHDVTSSQFATDFPITTDQSVLPASGGPNSISSGGNFVSFTIDSLGPSGTPTPFLGSESANGPTGGANNQNTPQHPVPESLRHAEISATVFEGGLLTDAFNPAGGNSQGSPFTATGVGGALHALVNFGTDGAGPHPFQFVSPAAANAWLAHLGLTSHGSAIDSATINGNTIVASTDPGQASPHDVFSLTINDNGSWTFTLLAPVDDGPNQNESSTTIDLSGLIQAVDSHGLTIALSHDFTITIVDDAPLLDAATVSGAVQDSALTSPPDVYGAGSGALGGSPTVSGSLAALVSFGADGPAANGFHFITQPLAQSLVAGLGLTSHGNAIDAATIVGDTLTAFDSTHTAVFTLTVAGNGDYTFTLLNPIDNPTGPGPQIQFFNIDLSGLVLATDFDGNTIRLSHDFTINASNDVPFQTNFGGTTLQVDEQGFTQGSPGDLYGAGQFAGAANISQSGNLNTFLGFNFGAEGPATIGGKPAGYQITFANNTVHDIGVTSHGQDIDFFTVTSPVIDPTHGLTQTMTAWTGGGPSDKSAHEVFTLTVSGDGDFTFTIINPIDMPATAGTPNTFPLDLSPYISATDAVGDKIPIAPGTFLADVIGDVPLPSTAVVTGTVDEGALTTATDTDSTQNGNDPGASASVSGSLMSLVNFGANGPGTPAFALNTNTIDVGSALAAQNLTSHGFLINQASISGSTLTGIDSNGDHVFNLTINPDGTSYTFTLLEPIDQLTGADEKTVTIDLSSALTAFDFDGDPLATNADGSLEGFKDFLITVTDDVPTSAPGASLTASVNEGPLESGHNNPTVQTVTGASGALTGLFSFGADGPPATGATVAAVGNGAATTWISNLNLTSHGNSIDNTTETTAANVTTITAFDSANHQIFSLAINTNGAYEFDLLGQIDAPVNGTATVDLSGLVQAQDFDGDFGTLTKGTWTVSVADDRPVVSAVHAIGNENTPNPPSTISPNASPLQVTLSATDGDPNAAISFTVTSLPANGTLFTDAALTHAVAANTAMAASGNSLTLFFEPNAFFAGTDSFQYVALDSNGATSPTAATATIDVTPVADPPVLSESAQVALTPADSNTVTSTGLVALAGGGFAESWQVGTTILAQAFNAGGHALGTPVTVGTASGTAGNLTVALNGGGYAVAWTNGDDIFTQAFHADGTLNGATQQIDTGGQANIPIQLSALDTGGYAVLYERVDAGHEDVFTRVFGADGTPDAVGETQVNTVPPGDGSDNLASETGAFSTPQPVQMVTLANTDYVIAWSSQLNGQTVQLVRVFDDQGNPVTNEIQVSTPPAGDNDGGFNGASGGLVTALANGDFAVAWERSRPDGSTDILTKVFHASDSYAGASDVTVTAGGTNTENVQQIVALSTGGYVVMWSGGTLGNVHTFVQVYDANGHLADTNPADANGIQVDALVGTGNATAEQVLALADGRFAVMWQGGPEADPFVRVFNADGSPVGDGTPIAAAPSSATTLNSGVQMVEFADGTFAAVYDQTVNGGSGATATSQDHLFVQHFDASGNALGSALELVSSPFTGASLPELSNFDDFRLVLSNEGLLSTGGTTNDNGAFNINLGNSDTATGVENTPIVLFNASIPPDAFETLKITITGVPAGARFEINGTKVGHLDVANPSIWIIDDPAQTALLATSALEFVSLTAGVFTLHVDAQSTDTATLSTGPSTSTAHTLQDFTVTVADANDVALNDSMSSVTTLAGAGPLSLGIGAPTDIDNGTDLKITITAVPTYGVVQYTDASNNVHTAVDGTVLTAAELATLTFSAPAATPASSGDSVVYSVQDGATSVVGAVAVDVIPAAVPPIVTNVEPFIDLTPPPGNDLRELHTIALTGGGFVAIWASGPPGHEDITGKVFDSTGHLINTVFLQPGPNSDTQSNVVALGNGGFAVVWEDGPSLVTEAFDASGNPAAAGPQLVSTTALPSNTNAQIIVALADGNYAVVYGEQNTHFGTDDIFAQIFDPTGAAVGGPILANSPDLNSALFLNTATPETRDISQVVATDHGFVVMWDSFSDDGSGTASDHTYVRVINDDGTYGSPAIEVNAPSGANADQPSQVVALGGDDFAVMWQENNDETLTRIFKASDNYAGTTEIVTGAGGGGTNSTPWQIVELANGGYATVWNQIVGGVTSDVFAQVYDANGHLTGATPAGGIQVDTGAAAGLALADQIIALKGGGFAVEYDTLIGPDPSGDTFVRVFDAQGNPVGGQSQLNVSNPSAQFVTGVQTGMVALANGGFEALWAQTAGTEDQIWGQQFDANGNAIGAAEEITSDAPAFSLDEFKSAIADGTILTGEVFNQKTVQTQFIHTATGVESTPIQLINALPVIPDTLSQVTLSGFPPGSQFAIGGTVVGGLDVNDHWVITDPVAVAQLDAQPLTLIPPAGFTGSFTLTADVTETVTNGAQTSNADTIDNINVTVADANDVTLSNPSAVSVGSGSLAFNLNIGAPSDPDHALGENAVITIQALPSYGEVRYFDGTSWQFAKDGTVLTADELQSLQFVPPATGSFHGDSIVYSVQDGTSLVDGSIAITVTPPGGGLFFSADDPDLFTLDNQGNLTSIPVNPGSPNGSFAGEDGGFIQFANGLYFNANTDATGEVLFRLGPDNVAHPVTDSQGHFIDGISGVSADFTVYDGSLYFIGGGELHKIDPTGAVSEIKINPTGDSFGADNFGGFVQFDGDLYFTAHSSVTTGTDGTGLFFLDPQGNLNQIFTETFVFSPPSSFIPEVISLGDAGVDGGFATFNGALFFNGDFSDFGPVLFELDATGAANPITDDSSPQLFPLLHTFGEATYFGVLGGALFVTEQGSTPDSLWEIDSCGCTNEILYNNADPFDFTAAGQRNLGGITQFNGHLYFSADTATTDALTSGNPALFELTTTANPLDPIHPIVSTSEVLFNGNPITDAGENGGFITFNSHLYFFGDDASHPGLTALYTIDGNNAVSEIFDPTNPGFSFGAPGTTAPNQPGPSAHFTVFDGSLYFEAQTGQGTELVRIDSSGTAHVFNIAPDTQALIGSSFPGEDGGFGTYTPIATKFGTDGNDALSGGPNTVFIGGKGNDTIAGAGTNDTAVIDANFSDLSTHVGINGNTVTVQTANGTDTLTGIDRIQFADKGLLIVDPNGDFGFKSVQAAVNAASEGDTIWVMPGTYTETFTPTPYSSTPGGLFINTPNLTLEGVTADGTPFTSVSDANKDLLPTVISGAQTDFGSNIFVGPNADDTVIEGLHLQAGPETNNKLLEIWANNATVENNFLDVDIGGTTYSGAIAIYFNGNGSDFTHEVDALNVSNNILNEGIDLSNGVGIPSIPFFGFPSLDSSQVIANNTFEGTFDLSTGQGRYDTIVLNGQVPGIGWLLASNALPTITGNAFGDNTTPFLMRGSDADPTALPTLQEVQDFLANNGNANTTYAYVETPGGDLELALRNPGPNEYFSFAVTDTLDTLELALEHAGGNTVFPDQRTYLHPGDTVAIQSGAGALSSAVDVNNLFVQADQDSAHLTLTMATQLPDGEPIPGAPVQTLTLADYAPGQGANVTVIANNLGDTITTNDGQDTLVGGTGIDTAVYTQTLAAGNFNYDSADNVWHVSKGPSQPDTVSGFEKVTDGIHNFLLVGGGSQYATIQEAVNAAQDGDTILVAQGTYNENVLVSGKAVNFEGYGSVVLNGSITESGTLDQNMTIERFTINATGQQNGLSFTPTLTGPETITVNDVVVSGASETGFAVNGGGSNLTVDTNNSSFSGDGIAKTSGGSGDIDFFEFLGNAAFTNVQVTGVAQGTPLADAGDNGIQIAGFDEATKDVTSPLGLVSFDNVTVTGTYAKNLVYIQGYDNADGLNFPGAGLKLGNATTQTGWTPLFIDLGPQGGAYTPGGAQSTLDLANVDLAGWTFAGTSTNFAALAAAGYQDLIVGAPGTLNLITGTSGNDAIVYNQAAGGTEFVDGGPGTDAEIINGASGLAFTYDIAPESGSPADLVVTISAGMVLPPGPQVVTTNVEEIVLNLGNGGDTVNIHGNLGGTGVVTNTVTVNGGAGSDTVDASGITGAPIDVVFNGGGGSDVFHSGPGNDTFTDTGKGEAVYTEALVASGFSYAGGNWTVTTPGEGTDTLNGVSTVQGGSNALHFLLVSPDSQYTTIQAAIDAASAGDTVLVAPGTYDENVTLKDGVSLVGMSESGVVIDGSMTAPTTMSLMGISNLTVENGTPTSMLLDLRPTTDITDVEFSNVHFNLTSDFTGEMPIGNGQVSGTIALHDLGLEFNNVTMDSNDHNFANSVAFVYTLFQTDPGAQLLLDGVRLNGTASGGPSGLGAQWNMSPQDATTQNAAVTIENSSTNGGGNFYISGFDFVALQNNVLDGQGVALNGVKHADVFGNTFENIDGTFTANGTQHRGLVIEDAFGTTGDSDIGIANNTFSNVTEPDGAIALQRFTDGTPADLATYERLNNLFIENNTFTGLGAGVNPIFVNPIYFGPGAVVPATLDDPQLVILPPGNSGTQDLFDVVDTTYVFGPGHANLFVDGTANDTFIYAVGDGTDEIQNTGSGIDTLIIDDNGSAAQTFNINQSGFDGTLQASGVQQMVVNLGSGGDTVVLSGDLHDTGVATVTVNGGTGNDTVDARGITGTPINSGAPVDVVFNGGGGDDTFYPSHGNPLLVTIPQDTFNGGGGDTVVFSHPEAKYTIMDDPSTGSVVVFGGENVGTPDFSNVFLNGVTHLQFSDQTLNLSPVMVFDASHHLIGSFSTIQAGIDAATTSGDTVLIEAGTYTGQLVVDPTAGHGANGISIVGSGAVTIDAPGTLESTGNSPTSGRDIDGLLTVSNATNISLENISFNGLGEGNLVTGANNPTLVGIAYLNASGTVDHVDVTGIREPDSSFGDQRGIAIYASNTAPVGAPTESFTLTNSTIENWQKGGVVASNANVDIEHDIITGVGATALIAQNGIELVGDTGTASNNTITGIGYTPATVTDTGILFWDATNLTLDNNIIAGALNAGAVVGQTGIYGLNSSDITIHGNTISNVLEGIVGQEDGSGAFAGTFAPTWDIGPTNTVTNYTQLALDFEASDTNTNVQATGNFTVQGTAGNDLFLGGNGTESFNGEGGNDTFQFTDAQLHGGSQTVTGGAGSNSTLAVSDTTGPITIADADLVNVSNVDTLQIGTSGAATVTLGADASADVGAGTLTLDDVAGTGPLTLDAHLMTANLTVLLGTDGNDTLTGGSGTNTYQFGAPPAAGNNQITNFTTGIDEIAVSAKGFGGGLTAGMDASTVFESSGSASFASLSDRFHFDTTNHALYYSADGTTAHEVLLATTTNGGMVHPHDIHVVA
ncbi:MAG TPA: hypothetical protein VKX28_28665 [Xanthobacteraceae bacterium]|nr:hypothetical protein [Xanthobacteraceae bacterium]